MAEQPKKKQTMAYTDEELSLIKATFKGNEKLLKLIRKVFLPPYDPNAPIGQVMDLWLSLPIKEMNPQDAMINMLARNELIVHVEKCLMTLDTLAEREEKTPEEIKQNIVKNSSV